MLAKISAYFRAECKPKLTSPIGFEYNVSCIPFVSFLINWLKQFSMTEAKNPSH